MRQRKPFECAPPWQRHTAIYLSFCARLLHSVASRRPCGRHRAYTCCSYRVTSAPDTPDSTIICEHNGCLKETILLLDFLCQGTCACWLHHSGAVRANECKVYYRVFFCPRKILRVHFIIRIPGMREKKCDQVEDYRNLWKPSQPE